MCIMAQAMVRIPLANGSDRPEKCRTVLLMLVLVSWCSWVLGFPPLAGGVHEKCHLMQGTPLFPSHKAILFWTTDVDFFSRKISVIFFFSFSSLRTLSSGSSIL
ncbi:uncharacterized protein CLUP02_05009 [Colletotrichum lupini]|uniref:Uncharacterized protein n=2 Tax=Colletotrichum acutatum species complex TaxID=2707335 RepID=A0A9Q8SLG0_9PEZI|nr:uncharacterized protein CLUP02_05009 [Colletotrichum lupini]KAK1709646.1 hypothetical protein BDP67DRAFT_116788 [Colletotrichum lupini]UQC79529.1 hypothetical protein CLUP02_05009 [Colletotrichum lupini]